MPELDAATRATIDAHLPAYGTSQNPIDVTAQAVFQIGYARFAQLAAASPIVDGVMMVSSLRRSQIVLRERDVLAQVVRETTKPILFWSYTQAADDSVAIMSEAGFPLFSSMRACARAMRVMADYRRTRERRMASAGMSPQPHPARAAVRGALDQAGPIVSEWEARPLLAAYEIGAGHAGVLVQSADEAVAAAARLGCAVALKVQSPDIPHKTEAGAVALGVATQGAVAAAHERIIAAACRYQPSAAIQGVLVAPMAPAGLEMILGVTHDSHWGPLLMVGFGGVLVDILDDVALAPVPLGAGDARALLDRLRGRRLLDGHRGAPPADIGAMVALMVSLSQFAAEHADVVAEIDLNPVLLHAAGVTVVDALIVKHATRAPRVTPTDAG